ncbi:ABC transporter substrate-binding protein [Patescibacteria group bacterium]
MNLILNLYTYLTTLLLALAPFVPSYTEGVTGQPESFLPSQATSRTDRTISELMYRGLFKYDIYGTLVPDLVSTWSISEDGMVYTITIKENQYWSNGKKITADDVIYTSYSVSNLAGVGTDKVDDLTVRFSLPNKYSPFLGLLTVGIMPAGEVEKGNPIFPTSSGPFRVARVEREGPLIREVVLVHNNRQEKIKRLSFRFYANEKELVTAARLGDINGFLAGKEHQIEGFSEYKFPVQGVYYALHFNLREEKFQDLVFRQKLAKVLPLDELTFNKGIPVEGAISRSAFTDDSINYDYYDETVSDVLSDTTVIISVPDIKEHLHLANEIKRFWEGSLGLDVRIRQVDPDEIVEDVINKRDFEVLLFGQEVSRDPDRYVNWHSTQIDPPGLNISGFEHVRSDRALEEGRNEPDQEARISHYNQFQNVIHEQVPAIFLYHPFATYYVSDFYEGIGEKHTFTLTDRFLDFDNWERVKTN